MNEAAKSMVAAISTHIGCTMRGQVISQFTIVGSPARRNLNKSKIITARKRLAKSNKR